MRVILAEKPSVARDLARVLGCTNKEQGYFAGARDLVTWAVGHLVRIEEPDRMNPDWGKPWRREALPMIPGQWLMAAEPKTADQFQVISRLFKARTTTEIVNATDAGREGESIFRRIYALSGSKKPVVRFWTSSLTDEAIRDAFGRLRPAREYDALGAAAEARARLDWLIGMNHSRASTLHNHMLCSVGRVQTPTLAMVVRRHHEMEGWVKTLFYEVHADLNAAGGNFIVRALNPGRGYEFDRKPEAEAILADCPEGTPARVTAYEVKPRRIPPPQLHNLGELQKEANRRFGLKADQTLALAQSLYEKKVLTYPRSSSRYLSEDMVPSLPGVLRALELPGREALVEAALGRTRSGPKLSKRFVDGSKLSDHHAIIPTAKRAPAGLSADERKVYLIVAERFLAIFLPDKEVEETRIDVLIAGHPFRATGTRLIAPGWTVVSGRQDLAEKPDDAEPPQQLPRVQVGEVLSVLDAELVTRERKPPAPYTDATLLAAMETAGKELDDEAMREAMRGRGLGTEATRASILEKLLALEYVVRDGKKLRATGKGVALIAQLLPHLKSPELTGDMEARLTAVERGELDAEVLLAEVAESLRHEIPAVFRSAALEAPRAEPVKAAKGEIVCPKCRAGVLSRRAGTGQAAKSGGFYGCSRFREGCNFAVNTVVAGKTITAKQVAQLCSAKRGYQTEPISGFTSRAGKNFEASLRLDTAQDWKVEFAFGR